MSLGGRGALKVTPSQPVSLSPPTLTFFLRKPPPANSADLAPTQKSWLPSQKHPQQNPITKDNVYRVEKRRI